MTPIYADPETLLTAPWKRFDRITSTNQYLLDLPDEDLQEGATCTALIQTSGIGRKNRTWHSPLGGLYLSIAVKPSTPPSTWGQISLLMACAGARAIATNYPDIKPGLKWPNDVLIEDRKVAGILLQSCSNHPVRIVAGIGINVSLNPVYLPKRPIFPATVLSFESNYPPNLKSLGKSVRQEFIELYCMWQRNPDKIVNLWQALCGLTDRKIVFKTSCGIIEGIYHGITEQGHLKILSGEKLQTFANGEIIGIEE